MYITNPSKTTHCVTHPPIAPHWVTNGIDMFEFKKLVHLLHASAVAEFCGNVELCRLTEQVVFSDPYKVSQYNHWTSPYLDGDAEAVREDNTLKLEVAELKSMYYIILEVHIL